MNKVLEVRRVERGFVVLDREGYSRHEDAPMYACATLTEVFDVLEDIFEEGDTQIVMDFDDIKVSPVENVMVEWGAVVDREHERS